LSLTVLVEVIHPRSKLAGYSTENKVYSTGRKVTENFKEKMKIVFDDYLGKWNYRAIPEVKT